MPGKNKDLKLIGILIVGGLFIGGLLSHFRDSYYSKRAPTANENAAEVHNDRAVFIKNKIEDNAQKTKQNIEKFSLDQNPLSQIELQKWILLKEILISKNDNDPRIDQDFKELSENFHRNLYRQYQALPDESRNERGFIVFLVARDLKNSQDIDFLKSIYNEKPCMSLVDCSAQVASDPHHSSTNETSESYPQLAGLYSMDKSFSERPDLLNNPDMKEKLKDLIRTASTYPVPGVRKKAEEISTKYHF